MAVPCGDQRDWDFTTHFGLDIINIFENIDVRNQEKDVIIVNSDFLNGLKPKKLNKLVYIKLKKKE